MFSGLVQYVSLGTFNSNSSASLAYLNHGPYDHSWTYHHWSALWSWVNILTKGRPFKVPHWNRKSVLYSTPQRQGCLFRCHIQPSTRTKPVYSRENKSRTSSTDRSVSKVRLPALVQSVSLWDIKNKTKQNQKRPAFKKICLFIILYCFKLY